MTKVAFTEKTTRAIYRAGDYCAADLPRATPLLLAEVALDANRLTTIAGAPEADAEVAGLVKEFGYPKVLKAAAKLFKN